MEGFRSLIYFSQNRPFRDGVVKICGGDYDCITAIGRFALIYHSLIIVVIERRIKSV